MKGIVFEDIVVKKDGKNEIYVELKLEELVLLKFVE